jgi:hypothetical protein
MNATAENVGAALGRVAARLDEWKAQRAAIAEEIRGVLSAAERLLGEIGDTGGSGGSYAPERKNKGGRPKGYKMSEATKRKLRAAWKRRKAAMKASA